MKLEENALKRRKSSVALDLPVNDIDQLPEDRKKTAQSFHKQIKALVESTLKGATHILLPGETAETKAIEMARDVEYELYTRFPRSEEVTAKNDQLRSIIFNFKKNLTLFRDVLAGALSARELAHMSSEDMASEELQKERAALKEEADKQATIHHEDGPRVRKTHKGDELVIGDDEHQRAVAEPMYTPTAHSTNVVPESPRTAQSPSGLAMSPTTMGGIESGTRKPLTVNTSAESPRPRADRKTSNSFDIQSVWSKVKSPEVPQGVFQPKPSRMASMSQTPVAARGPGEDADIDRLLDDDEMDGVVLTGSPAHVWKGNLFMRKQHSPLNVSGTAHFFGGADASLDVRWPQLLHGDVEINGRIASEKADEYLGNFRWSTTKIMSVLKFVPDKEASSGAGENGAARSNFSQIFDYFTVHGRWGVSKGPEQPDALKDFYVVPVRAGTSPLPKCLNFMENIHLDGARAEDVLYFVLVVQVRDTPTGDRPPSAVLPLSAPQSALLPLESPFPMRVGDENSAATAAASQRDGPSPATSSMPDATFTPPPLAVEILGEYVNTHVARSVLQLPEISRQQLENLKHAFETDPMTRQDLNYLSQFLRAQASQAMQGQQAHGENQGEVGFAAPQAQAT